MVDVTIFEVHLPEATFNAPFAGDDEPETGSHVAGTSDEERDETNGGKVLTTLLVLLVFAGLAWVLRRRSANQGGSLESELADG